MLIIQSTNSFKDFMKKNTVIEIVFYKSPLDCKTSPRTNKNFRLDILNN